MANRMIAAFACCHGHFYNIFCELFQIGSEVGSLRRVTLPGMLIHCLRNPEGI